MYSYPRGNGPHYLLAQPKNTTTDIYFDRGQEGYPHCIFPLLYPIEKPENLEGRENHEDVTVPFRRLRLNPIKILRLASPCLPWGFFLDTMEETYSMDPLLAFHQKKNP